MLKAFWGAFVDGLLLMALLINEEKVASSKKHMGQLKTRVQKPYPVWDQMAKIDTQFLTETAKKLYPLGPRIPI